MTVEENHQNKNDFSSVFVIDGKALNSIFSTLKDLLSKNPLEFYKIIGPKSVQIELTNDCDLSCTMCDHWMWVKEDPELKGDLTTDDVKDLLKQLKELGTVHLLLTGGEPLLRSDLSEILKSASGLDISVTLITNGVALNENLCNTLSETKTSVIFSVDGSNQESYHKIRGKDHFDKVLENITMMVKVKAGNQTTVLELHMVIQKENVNEIVDFYELGKSLGVDRVSYSLAHGPHLEARKLAVDESSIDSMKDNLRIVSENSGSKPAVVLREVLQNILDDKIPIEDISSGLPVKTMFKTNPVPCLSLTYWAFIDAFGNVYPCCYSFYDNLSYNKYSEERSKYCLGNIHQQSIAEIWDGTKFNELRTIMDPVNIENNSDVCGQCGSYFFFKNVIDEISSLRNDIESGEVPMEKILERAQTWVNSLETIDRSGKINIAEDLMKLFGKIE